MALAYALVAAVLAAFAALLAAPGPWADHGTPMRVVRWMVRLMGRLLDALSRTAAADALLGIENASISIASLRSWFARHGIKLSQPQAAAALMALCPAASLAGAVLAGSSWGMVVGIGAYAVAVVAHAARRQRSRAQALSAEMPAVYRSLAVSLGSGLTLSQSIAYVGGQEDSVAAPAFAQCSLRLLCGYPYDTALDELAQSLDTPGAGLLSSALAISHRTGSPLQSLFMRSAALVERAGELERLLAVKTAQVRLSVRIVCLLPALLVAVLLMISPDFRAGLATSTGIVSLCLATCMDVVAVIIVRSLSKGIL